MQTTRLFLSSVLAVLYLAIAGNALADPKADGIVLMHVRFTQDRVEILDSQIAPGRLKPAPERAGDRVLLQVFSAAGAKLWEGSIADPYTEILEAGAARADLSCGIKVMTHDSREMTVRVPFFSAEQVLRIVRMREAETSAPKSEVLGTFQLPNEKP